MVNRGRHSLQRQFRRTLPRVAEKPAWRGVSLVRGWNARRKPPRAGVSRPRRYVCSPSHLRARASGTPSLRSVVPFHRWPRHCQPRGTPNWLCQDFPLHPGMQSPDRPYLPERPPWLRSPFVIAPGQPLFGGIAVHATGLVCLPLCDSLLKAGAGCFLESKNLNACSADCKFLKLKEVSSSVGAVCRGGLSLRKPKCTLT